MVMETPYLSIFKEDVAELDRILIGCVLLLVGCGLLCVFSAGAGRLGRGWDFALRQTLWMVGGCFAMFFVVAVGYRRLLNAAYPIYLMTLFLLFLTVLLAPRIKGAQSWLSLGFFRFQPSEFAKISLILVLSKWLSRYPPLNLRAFLGGLGVAAPAVLLVLAQPDAGSALVYIVITFGMLFIAGTPLRYLGTLAGCGLALTPFLWFFLKEYQKLRLLVFLDPTRDPLGAGYNVIQSRIAVGSGGFWGKGFMNGMQSKLRFLPEPHTDFIFSVYSEEFGFWGTSLLLFLFALLFFRIIAAGLRSRDRRCKILVSGVAVWIWFQMFESIGMSIGLMPVTGLPLPFLSYGGSALLAVFIALGLVGSVYVDSAKRFLF
ncbi:MAG: rod shape-determining protein RodA [Fretibacterium sp.]|uniref:rod shape-determining protein RodA n=1 Tax=Fretibacterium sp. OH1220_COT-178 TaxID=2491047 RepID=UPI001F2888B5|nr:rod shape-determining protein RodA [Fretibacterium sp. OH1220_COT-178]MDO4786177.1 rod shape-determining protein RodA [Fretibacterium sp.]